MEFRESTEGNVTPGVREAVVVEKAVEVVIQGLVKLIGVIAGGGEGSAASQ